MRWNISAKFVNRHLDPLAGGIPEDWQALHGNTRKKLAKAISGAPVEGLEEADAIIAAEVQLRAANP